MGSDVHKESLWDEGNGLELDCGEGHTAPGSLGVTASHT